MSKDGKIASKPLIPRIVDRVKLIGDFMVANDYYKDDINGNVREMYGLLIEDLSELESIGCGHEKEAS